MIPPMQKVLAVVFLFGLVDCVPTTPVVTSPRPAFQQDATASAVSAAAYVPHVTYPYADGYGPVMQQQYDPYGQPNPLQGFSYAASLMPAAQNIFQVALKVLVKLGIFLAGGLSLLAVGGLLTTAVCSLTPLCTIQYHGFGPLDKDTVRALMTPEKLSTAAAIVQDAIGKYQRMQRSTKNA